MRFNCLLALLFILFFSSAQKNSLPYKNTSLIQVHDISQEVMDSLLKYNVIPFSCRAGVSDSEIIVDVNALNWLIDYDVSFSIVHDNVENMIDHEMKKIYSLKSNRTSNWFSVYRELSEVEEKINQIALSSNIVTQEVVGQSYEGRDILGVKISIDNGIEDKPAIFINGCQHAREWSSPMAATYLIQELSEHEDTDSEINMFLNGVDIYIIPIVNPDGYLYTWQENRYWRKNRQLNSDSDCVGTDLNRNWNLDWNGEESTSQDPCSYIYVGTGPFSAPETQAVSDYMLSIPNLVGHIDIHSYSALIVAPWGHIDEPTDDNDEFFCLGTKMQSVVSNTNNYPYVFGVGTVNNMLYLVSGGMPDWTYNSFGALSYLYELRPHKPLCGWPGAPDVLDCNEQMLAAFNNDEEEIVETCEEFYQGFVEMLKWAYLDNCDYPFGCSDPEAENFYCNTPQGNMGCLLDAVFYDVVTEDLVYIYNTLPLGFLDDGSCTYSSSIEDVGQNNFVVKTIDFLGRENIDKGLVIQMFNDGSYYKKYIY